MFKWLRKKKNPFEMAPVPPQHAEKAFEYQQVAALLCMDIDLLVEVCKDPNLSKEDILWQINDLKDKKDKITTDKKVRDDRFSAAHFLFGLSSQN